MKKKVIIVSGYFNPLHKGHIEYFLNAKKHGDKLFVIVNSDYQRKVKGSKEFMNEDERVFIINQLKIVDKSFISIEASGILSLISLFNSSIGKAINNYYTIHY